MEENQIWCWQMTACVCAIVSLLIMVVTMFYVRGKVGNRLGISSKPVEPEDCNQAVKMVVDFLSCSLKAQGRAFKETDAGCDSLTVLRDSKDIATLIEEVHLMGGRLVLRKVGDHDIERAANTPLEVKKKLTDLDIAFAKRVSKIKRR